MFGSRPTHIRCPTCHRTTPAADVCTKCGAAIPATAFSRPRGIDRDELQARIRARRLGQPFRRGSTPAQASVPYEPEPWDEASLQYPPEPAQWDTGTGMPPAGAPGEPSGPRYVDPAYAEPAPYGDPRFAEPIDPVDQTWTERDRDVEATDVRYETAYARRESRRAPGAPFLVLGLILLGALALGGGAVLAGALTRRADTAADVPSVTPVATSVATPAATATPAVASPLESASATATPRFVFEDGFTATAEPCLVQPGLTCPAPGTVVPPSNGTVWILVKFQQIRGGDLIGVHGVTPDGDPLGDASWQAPGGANSPPANGHAYFGYSVSGLPEGEYEITVTRNGEDAAVTTFRIEG